VGLVIICCTSLGKSYFLIKNLLNSHRAGDHSNLVTLDVSGLIGVGGGFMQIYRQLWEQFLESFAAI
jgi:hypothetical protein